MIFKVLYSQEKDIWNYLNSLWRFTHPRYGRKDIQERLLSYFPLNFTNDLTKAGTEKEARDIVIKYLNWLLGKNSKDMSSVISRVQGELNKKQLEVIRKLEEVYKQKFPFKRITVYLTTVNIFPYSFSERWFMSGKNQILGGHIKIALHELNHFMFYYYYPDLKKELGQEKYEILKEALAIYTNSEGNDKPAVKRLEDYFKKNLNKSIPEVLAEGEWQARF